MICNKCGAPLDEGVVTCPACGNSVANYSVSPQGMGQSEVSQQKQPIRKTTIVLIFTLAIVMIICGLFLILID